MEDIIALCQELSKILSAFKLIKNVLPTRYRGQVYYAFNYSQVIYGTEVFGATTKANIS